MAGSEAPRAKLLGMTPMKLEGTEIILLGDWTSLPDEKGVRGKRPLEVRSQFKPS